MQLEPSYKYKYIDMNAGFSYFWLKPRKGAINWHIYIYIYIYIIAQNMNIYIYITTNTTETNIIIIKTHRYIYT